MIETSASHLTPDALRRLVADPALRPYIDSSRPLPGNFRGDGPIRLIILGQDPTVRNAKALDNITTALNLDKSGSLKTYLLKACGFLGVDLEREVFATNLYKNFFVQPPTSIDPAARIFERCLPYWKPALDQELAEFPNAPVLILGEPLLTILACSGASAKVRHYWGYQPDWKTGAAGPFAHLPAGQNILNRLVFPFPHQPSWQKKKFYSSHLEAYCHYTKSILQQQVDWQNPS